MTTTSKRDRSDRYSHSNKVVIGVLLLLSLLNKIYDDVSSSSSSSLSSFGRSRGCCGVDAFVVYTQTPSTKTTATFYTAPVSTTFARLTRSRLFYIYNDTIGDGNDGQPSPKMAKGSTGKKEQWEIPILGPLLDRPKPLLIGESMTLKPPITPLQWYTIQTCVDAQQQQQGQDDALDSTDGSSSSTAPTKKKKTSSYVTIDESPIVAVLHQGSKEYATLAAIVGISSSSSATAGSASTTTTTNYDDDEHEDDDDDFHSKINRLALDYMNTRYYNDKSQVRLVGIGRVKLSHITTKNLDLIGHGGSTTEANHDEDDDDRDEWKEPIVVAQRIQLLWDNSTKDGEYTKASSPVHSISKLSTQASKIRMLHKQRQSLTHQLQMAQTRLDMASQQWQDYDGIGSIGSSSSSFRFYDTVPSPSASTPKRVEEESTSLAMSTTSSSSSQSTHECGVVDDADIKNNVSLTTTLPSYGASRCLNVLENYGMGFTQSAIADLDAMADVLISVVLRPYFSPQVIDSEEFIYEALSWVALSSVQMYCTSDELVDAMFHTTRTAERFDIIYNAQLRHKQDLVELTQRKQQELLDCGEECTDIF
jgi:hypothetical protein